MVATAEIRARMERIGAGAPTAARMARLRAHAWGDDAVSVAAIRLHSMSRLDLDRVERETDRALEQFERRGFLDDPASYHLPPPPLTDPDVRPAVRYGLRHEHLRFPSRYVPRAGEPGRERWLGPDYTRNRTAHARVLRHSGPPRPWVVCVHGTGMGWSGIDFPAFRVHHLHEELGLNVALPVLPLSGPRMRRPRTEIHFPGSDNLDMVHGFAQCVWDIRRLISWIRSSGGEHVGVHGISLGGYVVALHAAFEERLSCVVAGVPAADFPGMVRGRVPAPRADHYDRLHERSVQVQRVVSPLEFVPRTEVARRFVYAGLSDRMVDPLTQSLRLWEHWGSPRALWYDGGHLSFGTSTAVAAFIGESFRASGLLPSHQHAGPARQKLLRPR